MLYVLKIFIVIEDNLGPRKPPPKAIVPFDESVTPSCYQQIEEGKVTGPIKRPAHFAYDCK